MSSDFHIQPLTAGNLKTLQKVLADAGYTGNILAGRTAGPNIAAKLLVRQFQEGMTRPSDLAAELERRFGRPERKEPPLASPLHRDAIRGMTLGQQAAKSHSRTII